MLSKKHAQEFGFPHNLTDTSYCTRVRADSYPGAKEYYHIDENDWDDRGYMTQLVTLTAGSLPAPTPQKPKAS